MVFDVGQTGNGISQLTQSSPGVSAALADDVHCLLGLRQNPGAVAIRFQVVDSYRERPGRFARYFFKLRCKGSMYFLFEKVSGSPGNNATSIKVGAGGKKGS